MPEQRCQFGMLLHPKRRFLSERQQSTCQLRGQIFFPALVTGNTRTRNKSSDWSILWPPLSVFLSASIQTAAHSPPSIVWQMTIPFLSGRPFRPPRFIDFIILLLSPQSPPFRTTELWHVNFPKRAHEKGQNYSWETRVWWLLLLALVLIKTTSANLGRAFLTHSTVLSIFLQTRKKWTTGSHWRHWKVKRNLCGQVCCVRNFLCGVARWVGKKSQWNREGVYV